MTARRVGPRLIRALWVLSIVSLTSGAAFAETPRAPLGAARGPTQRVTLDNGLELFVDRRPDLPLVAMNISFQVGTRDDPADLPGLAELMRNLLTSASTRHIRGQDRNDVIRAMGLSPWQVNSFAGDDRTTLSMVVPARALELALWLESDRMGYFSDGIDALSVTNAVDAVRDAEKARSPFDALQREAERALQEEADPRRNAPDFAALGALGPRQARVFARERYGPGRASLALAGDLDPARTVELVKKYFGPLARVKSRAPSRRAAIASRGKLKLELTGDVKQPSILLEWRTPAYTEPDDVALDVIARFTSAHLGDRLVLQSKIAEWVNVRQVSRSDESFFRITAGPSAGHDAAELRKIIDDELDALRGGRIQKADADAARTRLLVELAGARDNIDDRVLWNNSMFWLRGDPDYFDTYFRAYEDVDAARMSEVARRRLPSEPALEAVLSPGKPRAESSPKVKRRPTAEPKASPAPLSDAQFRYRPPKIGKLDDFKPAQPQDFRLDNGVRVLVQEDPKAHRVLLRLVVRWYAKPACCRIPEIMGSLFVDAARNDGTTLADLAHRLGSWLSLSWDEDSTEITLPLLPEQLETAAAGLVDAVVNGRLDAQRFERVRKRSLERLEQENALQQAYAWTGSVFRAPGQRAYDSAGDRSMRLGKLKLADLVSYRKRAIDANALKFTAIGPIDEARARRAFSAATAALPAAKPKSTPSRGLTPGLFVIDDPKADATELVAFVPVARWAESGHAASLALHQFLRTAEYVKPNMHERLKAAGVDSYSGAEGHLIVRADSMTAEFVIRVPPKLAPKAIKALLDQFESLQKGEISGIALADARRETAAWIVDRYVDPHRVLDQLSLMASVDAGSDVDSMLYTRALMTTRDDLVRAAKRYLNRERLSVVALGPVGDTLPALEQLGMRVRVLDLDGHEVKAR